MLRDQPVAGGATYRASTFTTLVIDVPSGMMLVRSTGNLLADGHWLLGLEDVESGSWLSLDLLTGEELGREVIESSQDPRRDVGALFDQIAASARTVPATSTPAPPPTPTATPTPAPASLTTLAYDRYDATGAVTTAGSYAFLTTGDDGTMTAVTTYEALRNGTTTSLRIHTSDAKGVSRSGVLDSVEAGDILEWREAGQCWVRYRVTAAPQPAAGAATREYGVEWVTYAYTGCSGALDATATASVQLNPPAFTSAGLAAPVRHGPYLLHPIGWDGPLQPQVATAPLGGAQGSSSADRAVSDDLAVVMAHPFWREPDFPDGWTLHSAAVGYEGIDGYFAIYLDARGGFGADVQVARLPRLPDYVSAPDGLSIYEARTIDGHPAVVRYSLTGDLTHETSVYIFHEATGIEYLVVGVSPRAGGSPDIVIAAARSLYRAAGE
ncbi:MAG: hypothetical protein F4X26_02075 [Chloroflexi bacterium]|nr:hypothetical protein [Chloroflexota bacterium]